MQYRKLGQADIDVSVIAMGCWGIGGGAMWGTVDDDESVATIHAALDSGINFFDTAEVYGSGHSEEVMGRAFKGRRHQAVIATKASPSHYAPEALREACDASLRRLRTDYIDLYQLHWPIRTDVRLEDVVGTLDELKGAGKLRAVGVCNFGPKNLTEVERAVPDSDPWVSNQLAYSLLWRAIEFEIVPACERLGMGILAYSALLHGLLTGRYDHADQVPQGRARTRHFSTDRPEARHGEPGQEDLTFSTVAAIRSIAQQNGLSMTELALAWVVHQPQVSAVLAGATKAEQIRENARVAQIRLDDELLKSLDEATRELRDAFGANADMWQSPGRME